MGEVQKFIERILHDKPTVLFSPLMHDQNPKNEDPHTQILRRFEAFAVYFDLQLIDLKHNKGEF